jgi:hypothetical protein
MDILEWLHLLSANVKSSDLNDLTFIFYIVTAIYIKKSRYLLAFSLSVLLIECSLFDDLQEYQLYLTYFIVYSYICSHSVNAKTKMACGIMCLLDLLLAYDALYYGVDGLHGERQTVIYQNIEYLAFSAHILIIISLIRIGRILDDIRGLFGYVFSVSGCSSYLLIIWYNISKIQSANK